MNLSFSSISKHLGRGRRPSHARDFVSPSREWFIGVALAAAVFLIGCMYAGLFFLEVGKGAGAKSEEIASTLGVSYRHEEVKEVLDLYVKRSAEFEALKAKAPAARVAPADSESQGSSAPLAE